MSINANFQKALIEACEEAGKRGWRIEGGLYVTTYVLKEGGACCPIGAYCLSKHEWDFEKLPDVFNETADTVFEDIIMTDFGLTRAEVEEFIGGVDDEFTSDQVFAPYESPPDHTADYEIFGNYMRHCYVKKREDEDK